MFFRIIFSTNSVEKLERQFSYILNTLQSIYQNFSKMFQRFFWFLLFRVFLHHRIQISTPDLYLAAQKKQRMNFKNFERVNW